MSIETSTCREKQLAIEHETPVAIVNGAFQWIGLGITWPDQTKVTRVGTSGIRSLRS